MADYCIQDTWSLADKIDPRRIWSNAAIASLTLGGSMVSWGMLVLRSNRTTGGRIMAIWLLGAWLLLSSLNAEEGTGPDPIESEKRAEPQFLADRTVEYVPGTLPLIIGAPHGGRLTPESIPNRKEGVLRSDSNTDRLARDIVEAIRALTGESPHLVICHLKRIKVDCNRDLLTGTAGHPGAEKTWRAFHGAIESARDAGAWIYLDIHGHSHPEGNIELGYLLTNAQLKQEGKDAIDALEQRSSVAAWKTTSKASFAERLRGKSSLGGQLEIRGYPSVPSPAQPHAGEAKYFNGGYNTARYGSRGDLAEAVAIQIECPYPSVRDSETNRKAFAAALAAALIVPLDRHAGITLPVERDIEKTE